MTLPPMGDRGSTVREKAGDPEEVPAGRIQSVDGLRTLMCTGIMLYHFIPYFFVGADWESVISRYFSCFTDMFFVLSGLFVGRITSAPASFAASRDWLVPRLGRIYPLHLVTLAIYVSILAVYVAGLTPLHDSDRYDVGSIIPHLTLTHAWGFGSPIAFNYPSWAISAILLCYLVFLATARVLRGRAMLPVAVIASFAVGSVAASYAGTTITGLQSEGLGALRALPSFFFGAWLAQARPRSISKAGGVVLMGVALVLAFGHPDPLTGVSRLAAVYLLVTAVIVVDRSRTPTPLTTTSLRALAKYSFGVYMLHSVVATIFFRLILENMLGYDLITLGDNNLMLSYFYLGCGLLLSFAAAAISLRTVERIGAKAFAATFARRTTSDLRT